MQVVESAESILQQQVTEAFRNAVYDEMSGILRWAVVALAIGQANLRAGSPPMVTLAQKLHELCQYRSLAAAAEEKRDEQSEAFVMAYNFASTGGATPSLFEVLCIPCFAVDSHGGRVPAERVQKARAIVTVMDYVTAAIANADSLGPLVLSILTNAKWTAERISSEGKTRAVLVATMVPTSKWASPTAGNLVARDRDAPTLPTKWSLSPLIYAFDDPTSPMIDSAGMTGKSRGDYQRLWYARMIDFFGLFAFFTNDDQVGEARDLVLTEAYGGSYFQLIEAIRKTTNDDPSFVNERPTTLIPRVLVQQDDAIGPLEDVLRDVIFYSNERENRVADDLMGELVAQLSLFPIPDNIKRFNDAIPVDTQFNSIWVTNAVLYTALLQSGKPAENVQAMKNLHAVIYQVFGFDTAKSVLKHEYLTERKVYKLHMIDVLGVKPLTQQDYIALFTELSGEGSPLVPNREWQHKWTPRANEAYVKFSTGMTAYSVLTTEDRYGDPIRQYNSISHAIDTLFRAEDYEDRP
jgi:hypothetical protein